MTPPNTSDDAPDNEVMRDIELLIESGRSLRQRCETIVEALSGIEEDARTLRRVVKEVRRTFPQDPKPKSGMAGFDWSRRP